jgi:uncharacterized membrane protein
MIKAARNNIMRRFITITLLIFALFLTASVSKAQEVSNPVVHAVLFYSPSCGHCEYVITEVLPPLFDQYGEQLMIIGVDITQPGGHTLFINATQSFHLESAGVPFLVIGDTYLIGSIDIPGKLPGLIEQYLAQGGLDWPPITGLAEALDAAPITPAATTKPTTEAEPTTGPVTPTALAPSPTPGTAGLILSNDINLTVWERLGRDPAGNGLSIIVLMGMLFALFFSLSSFQQSDTLRRAYSLSWLIPLFSVVGLVVAGYLSYVETNPVMAYCGPVGDCNAVQQSQYARLFGILPIGILGIFGYVMILLAWIIGRLSHEHVASYASLSLFGMSILGVMFSVYLTFLEPFIIGATCAWCLTSAIIMTGLLWLSIKPGKAAFAYIFLGEKYAKKRKRYRSTF